MPVHIAIMRPKWGLLPKILNGQKTVETRWYKTRRTPWGKIKPGDTIYFKDARKPVTVVANVAKVEQYENLTPEKTMETLNKVALQDLGIDVPQHTKSSSNPSGQRKQDVTTLLPPEIKNYIFGKRYAIIIWLKDARLVKRPFNIDKTGFGAMASWLVFEDAKEFKRRIVRSA